MRSGSGGSGHDPPGPGHKFREKRSIPVKLHLQGGNCFQKPDQCRWTWISAEGWRAQSTGIPGLLVAELPDLFKVARERRSESAVTAEVAIRPEFSKALANRETLTVKLVELSKALGW